ncbi:MAG: hypothetical protein EOO48_06155 [Flavobacterium sp.]|nr:MAG: hypothetical protein EOO48_06155 [Flavobacterium sp.]
MTDSSQLKSETVDFAPISDADFDVDEESITSQDSFDDVPLTGSFPLCLSHDFLNPFCYTYPKTIVRHSPAFPERTIPIYLSNRVLRI